MASNPRPRSGGLALDHGRPALAGEARGWPRTPGRGSGDLALDHAAWRSPRRRRDGLEHPAEARAAWHSIGLPSGPPKLRKPHGAEAPTPHPTEASDGL